MVVQGPPSGSIPWFLTEGNTSPLAASSFPLRGTTTQFIIKIHEHHEVARLLAAKFIREVYHSKWLANVVMVPKKDKSLRMCIDFKHINRACPKDHFPLPRIDQIVDSTAGCERLSFLDAYSGYHQIRLFGPDEIKTAFITPFGCFCYITMPFGLKNAGATFMRMI